MGRIIVGMDESDGAADALRWAVREGELHGWTVTALMAWTLFDQHQPAGAARLDPSFDDEEALGILRDAVAQAIGKERADEVDQQVVCDLPQRALVEASHDAHLLVVGARGLGGFKSLLLGSVSYHCVQKAQCPVAVVRGGHAERSQRDRERIVTGVDGSDSAHNALVWALDEARAREAELEVVHAWGQVIFAGTLATLGVEVQILTDAADRTLASALEAVDTTGVPVTSTVVCDSAAGALLEAAGNADLVVVGSRGVGSLRGALLGSVSHQVVLHASCPVVVMPAER